MKVELAAYRISNSFRDDRGRGGGIVHAATEILDWFKSKENAEAAEAVIHALKEMSFRNLEQLFGVANGMYQFIAPKKRAAPPPPPPPPAPTHRKPVTQKPGTFQRKKTSTRK